MDFDRYYLDTLPKTLINNRYDIVNQQLDERKDLQKKVKPL